MPVVGVGWPIRIVLKHGYGGNIWVILIHGVRHINLAELLSQCNVLLRRHLLITKKDHFMSDQGVIDRFGTVTR